MPRVETSGMYNDDRLHITLPAQPDSLPVVRRAIVAHAEKLGIARAGIADLKTVVSEACANVVRHAYEEEDQAGTLEVALSPEADELSMVVRDFGGGIRPLSSDDLPTLRLGLPIIGALSSSFNLISVLSRGTEITIRFAYAEAR
jgi:anti-sigma regulatory factor (Ser/Thr protein kinase)